MEPGETVSVPVSWGEFLEFFRILEWKTLCLWFSLVPEMWDPVSGGKTGLWKFSGLSSKRLVT